jgi:protein-disulfide isomerase
LAIAAGLITVMVLAAMFYSRNQRLERVERIAERTQADDSIFVRPHSRSLGPENAEVTVVEFLDPECESCRAVYPMVKQLLAQYGNRVRLVVRYMPLHPNSVYAAGALEAAGEQGRFWDLLEVLFLHQPQWGSHHAPKPELIPGYAKDIGLDMEAFDRYLSSGAHKRLVEIDHADGKTLGVTGTPTFFVNGRPLERLGLAPLKALIDEELAK